MPLATEVDLGPGYIVLDGNRVPPERGTVAPSLLLMSIVAKRSPISATAEHLLEDRRVTTGFTEVYMHM